MALTSGFETKEFSAGSLTGSYQNFGSALSNPCYYAHIFNDSDVDVYISTDGSTNDIRVPSGFDLPLPYFSRHNTLIQGSYVFAANTQLQIKQVTASGSGNITAQILTVE